MRRVVLAAALLCISPVWSGADSQDHHVAGATTPSKAPISITINPESRVSVALVGPLPPSAQCGTAIGLSVKIINQDFVTALLEAELVGDTPRSVTIDFRPEPLKGLPEEFRRLYVTLTQPGPADITVSFRARHGARDLGGRDRIHFLMHCL